MKAKELTPEFKPIEIELVIESEDELRDLYVRLNAPYQVLLYSKPSNTDSIAVNHHDIKVEKNQRMPYNKRKSSVDDFGFEI